MKNQMLLIFAAILTVIYFIVRPKTAATTAVAGKPLYPSQQANNAAIVTGVSSVLSTLLGSQPPIGYNTPGVITNSNLLSGNYEYTSTQAELTANPGEIPTEIAPPNIVSGSSVDLSGLGLSSVSQDYELDSVGND